MYINLYIIEILYKNRCNNYWKEIQKGYIASSRCKINVIENPEHLVYIVLFFSLSWIIYDPACYPSLRFCNAAASKIFILLVCTLSHVYMTINT